MKNFISSSVLAIVIIFSVPLTIGIVTLLRDILKYRRIQNIDTKTRLKLKKELKSNIICIILLILLIVFFILFERTYQPIFLNF